MARSIARGRVEAANRKLTGRRLSRIIRQAEKAPMALERPAEERVTY